MKKRYILEAGWFPGEPFALLRITLFETACDSVCIFAVQIGYFCIALERAR